MFRRPQHIPDMFFSDSFSLSAAQPPDTGAAQQGGYYTTVAVNIKP